MEIKLLPHHIKRILGVIILLNIIMLTGTWIFHIYYYDILEMNWWAGSNIKYLLLEFSLGNENVIATWYSSMLLFCVALMSLLCFLILKQNNSKGQSGIWNYGWLMFFFIFATLSFDEMASMHERLGDAVSISFLADSPPGWVILLGVPIAVVAILMLWFCILQIKRAPWAAGFAILGILLFLSIPFQEMFEMRGWEEWGDKTTWRRPTFYLLLEEGSELFGTTFMLISTMAFAAYATNQDKKLLVRSSIKTTISINKNALVWIGVACSFLALLMLLVVESPLLDTEGENGVRRNWFPSSVAFLVCLLSIYIYSRAKRRPRKITYFFLAIFSLGISAYFGGDLYIFFKDPYEDVRKVIALVILSLPAGILAIRQLQAMKDIPRKLGVSVWAILMVVSIFLSNNFSAFIAFGAFTILLFSLFSRIISRSRNKLNRRMEVSPD